MDILPQSPEQSKAEFSAYAPFIAALPERPQACGMGDYIHAKRYPKSEALHFPIIQTQPRNRLAAIVLDIDRAGGAFAGEDSALPEPTFAVVNPDNKHAHLFYYLATPVSRGGRASTKAFAFYDGVREGMREITEADAGFTGFLAKNPMVPCWDTIRHGALFELRDLAWCVNRQRTRPSRKHAGFREAFAAAGRNCYIFESGRFWAYANAKKFFSEPDFFKATVKHFHDLNTGGLTTREVETIARSVSSWTWPKRLQIQVRRGTTSPEDLKARQQAAAAETHALQRARTAAKIAEAKAMLSRDGHAPSIRQIADFCGLGKSTVADALKTLPPTLF